MTAGGDDTCRQCGAPHASPAARQRPLAGALPRDWLDRFELLVEPLDPIAERPEDVERAARDRLYPSGRTAIEVTARRTPRESRPSGSKRASRIPHGAQA
jgi:hypothetical protein